MKFLGLKSVKNSKSFYILIGFLTLLVGYVIWLFIYLKIVGVYAVATLKECTASSEGLDFKYEFFYKGQNYTGSFGGSTNYKIGDRYFVSFSESNPDKNLLEYNDIVPDCLKDSINSVWKSIPHCSNEPGK